MSKTFRELSKTKWTTETTDREAIQLGCMLRIADATEAMSKSHIELQRDYNYMKDDRDYYRSQYHLSEKRVAAYKGHITRLKNKQKNNPKT